MGAERDRAGDGAGGPPAGAALTGREVAALLRCSPKTVGRLAGVIPGRFRVGRLVRYDRAAVAAWVRSGGRAAD